MALLGMEGTLGTGIGLLLGLALLKYSGYVSAVRKELSYIAAGAVFLLLAGVAESGLFGIQGFETAVNYINIIFVVVAFLLTLIGALLMAVQIFSKIR
jgi:hypothetical protein|tara:strand:- start:747 stop:1040 length:294 start_codon:yes stop_codon:yes gene_type:complete